MLAMAQLNDISACKVHTLPIPYHINHTHLLLFTRLSVTLFVMNSVVIATFNVPASVHNVKNRAFRIDGKVDVTFHIRLLHDRVHCSLLSTHIMISVMTIILKSTISS